MIELIKLTNGVARAYSTAAFRAANKHTVYGHAIAERHLTAQDVHRVRSGPKPAEAVGFKVVQESFPTLVDGVWVQGYVSVELTADEARALRNELLSATDWMAVADRTLTAAETSYRQALRDIPAQSDFPSDLVWPVGESLT